MQTNQYWASSKPTELKEHLTGKIDAYYRYIERTFLPLWQKSFQYYNFAAFTGGQLQVQGANNEFTTMGVNHYRNLIDHSITIAVNENPAWQARAVNSDTASQKQCILASGLLDYYLREQNLRAKLKQQLIYASLYGEGFMVVVWNATSGDAYAVDPQTNNKQYLGDVEPKVYAPIDVIRDPSLYAASNNQWYVVRDFVNKWDLIAKYGDNDAKVIAALQSATASADPKRMIYVEKDLNVTNDDIIPVYRFIHARTDALPEGRYTLFTEDVILTDGPLPSASTNVFRLVPGELDNTPFGYSNDYDILSIQQMINVLYSTIVSNQEAFGVQNIAVPRGSGTSITEVRSGMNLIEYDAQLGKPEALNLLSTPAEVFNFVKMLEAVAETIKGVNSVARGNPESSLKSGAALALVQSMAVQFMQGLQQNYIQNLEEIGTAYILLLREYASVPRVAAIVGKNKRSMLREFSSKDLQNVNRVQVDAGNPMSKTAAGRTNMAQMMIEAGLIKTPDEMLQVITTGNLDPLIQGQQSQLLLIQSENELLADGDPEQKVTVVLTDDHKLHIQEHSCVLSDPEARIDGAATTATLNHIMAHMQMLSSPAYMAYLQAMSGQPMPPQAGMEQLGASAEAMNPVPQGANDMAAENMPSLPNAPTIAGTDEQAQLPPGAAVQQ